MKKMLCMFLIFVVSSLVPLSASAENYNEKNLVNLDNERLIKISMQHALKVLDNGVLGAADCPHTAPRRYENMTSIIYCGYAYCYCYAYYDMEFCTGCERILGSNVTYSYGYGHTFLAYGSRVKCSTCGMIGDAAE